MAGLVDGFIATSAGIVAAQIHRGWEIAILLTPLGIQAFAARSH
jgi:hypothetical protein